MSSAPWKRYSEIGGDGDGGGCGGIGGDAGGGGLGGSALAVMWKPLSVPRRSRAQERAQVSAPLSDPRQVMVCFTGSTNSSGSLLSTATGLKKALGW